LIFHAESGKFKSHKYVVLRHHAPKTIEMHPNAPDESCISVLYQYKVNDRNKGHGIDTKICLKSHEITCSGSCKTCVALFSYSENYADSFYYKSGKKHSRIEWYSVRISDTENIYVFRDIDENEKIRFNNLRSIDLGKSGYTQEKFEENKEFFGVYVLQTN